MRKGICCAGNIVVDITYPIESWPKQGELTHITEGISRSPGGAVCNVIKDLAQLDPSLPLYATGVAGHDSEGDFIMDELEKHGNINTDNLIRAGHTSFTVVMSNNETKERTFFYHSGGTEIFGEADIDLESIQAEILHVGYALLLPFLDKEDPQYGTRMARLLHDAQCRGMKTSLDVVTVDGDMMRKIASPSLKYCDYIVINEVEAERISGIQLRDENDTLIKENLIKALTELKRMGVSTWAVIHCPELGCGIDENGKYHELPSLKVPKDHIKGTVGAGDAFCAGILYAAQNKDNLPDALNLARCTAAASLGSAGASDGVMSLNEVLELQNIFK